MKLFPTISPSFWSYRLRNGEQFEARFEKCTKSLNNYFQSNKNEFQNSKAAFCGFRLWSTKWYARDYLKSKTERQLEPLIGF